MLRHKHSLGKSWWPVLSWWSSATHAVTARSLGPSQGVRRRWSGRSGDGLEFSTSRGTRIWHHPGKKLNEVTVLTVGGTRCLKQSIYVLEFSVHGILFHALLVTATIFWLILVIYFSLIPSFWQNNFEKGSDIDWILWESQKSMRTCKFCSL